MTVAGLILMLRLFSIPDKPPLPFVDQGACPFECCHYGTWTARESILARTGRTRQAPILFTIAPGEKVTAMTGVVVTMSAGLVRMLSTTTFQDLQVPAGALLYVLHYGGEGSVLFWYDGKPHWGELYAETVHKGDANFPWDVESLPLTEWWVRVRSSRGGVGWVLMPAQFDGVDSCGALRGRE